MKKKELGKTSVGMRWSFRKIFFVRNDVFAIAKCKNWKKLGAPIALLTLPHEAFEAGMYQNTVNNGVWIQNRIKVTLNQRRKRGRPTGAITKFLSPPRLRGCQHHPGLGAPGSGSAPNMSATWAVLSWDSVFPSFHEILLHVAAERLWVLN